LSVKAVQFIRTFHPHCLKSMKLILAPEG
jgi:hypothetical protein